MSQMTSASAAARFNQAVSLADFFSYNIRKRRANTKQLHAATISKQGSPESTNLPYIMRIFFQVMCQYQSVAQ